MQTPSQWSRETTKNLLYSYLGKRGRGVKKASQSWVGGSGGMWHKTGGARSRDSGSGVRRSVAWLEAQAGWQQGWAVVWRRHWRSRSGAETVWQLVHWSPASLNCCRWRLNTGASQPTPQQPVKLCLASAKKAQIEPKPPPAQSNSQWNTQQHPHVPYLQHYQIDDQFQRD